MRHIVNVLAVALVIYVIVALIAVGVGTPEILILAFILGVPAFLLYVIIRAAVGAGVRDGRKP